jgi:uncharacterized membrane protein YbhN (UPF0104 family)
MENLEDKTRKISTSRLLRWIGTILALLLFFFILQQQDWDTIWATFQQLSVQIIIVVWILFVVRIVVNSVRWFIILQIANISIPYIESLKLFFLGMFISNFLPSTIGGDGIRFLALLKYEKDRSVALSSIITDRLINVVAMTLLLPISIIVYFDYLLLWNSKVARAAVLTGIMVKVNAWKSSIKELIERNKFWFQSPRELLFSLVVSWTAQLIYFLGVWLIAKNLGMSIRYYQVMGITVIAYFIALLPITINGYGLREITITSLYSILGYPIEAAISLAIVSRLIYMSTTLIGAVWLPEYLSYLDKKVPELR